MRLFFVGVLCAVAHFATAQCPYNASASLGSQTTGPTPAITCVETPSASGHWVITVTAHGLSSTVAGQLAHLHVEVTGGTMGSSRSVIIDGTDQLPKDGRSSPNEAVSVGRSVIDTDGTILNSEIWKSSAAPPTVTRWGDYFTVEPDPDELSVFWGHGQYQGLTAWRTWVGRVDLDDL